MRNRIKIRTIFCQQWRFHWTELVSDRY